MRLPGENQIRQPWLRRSARALILGGAALLLSSCAMIGGSDPLASAAPQMPANGPQSDYPVTLGEPYSIGGVTHRPSDTLNYDEVGYLAEDPGTMGFTGSHHSLPVPSYAEVTSLATGRTILVRLERRGPMWTNHLIALSPAAMAQLGASGDTPVRVRRVNPPEEQRALLRGGQSAPLRIDTPMSLVSVLSRRLPPAPTPGDARPPASAAAPLPATAPIASPPRPAATPAPAPAGLGLPPLADQAPPATPLPSPAPSPTPSPAPRASAPATGTFYVQAASFSSQDRAQRAASAIGGEVVPGGGFFRVRTGPFPTRAAAEASLANVRAAGYSDARILTSG